MIRAATPADVDAIRVVEIDAGSRFVGAGLPQVAADEPPSATELTAAIAEARAFVDVEGAEVVGWLLVGALDGDAHLIQVSVATRAQGRGRGRALVEQAAAWARSQGFAALTLTTFRDIPWNAPLYEHLGFRVLGDDEITPGLAAHLTEEARFGPPRVAMRLDL